MIKRLLIIGCFVVFFSFGWITVSANSGPPITGINVTVDVCQEIDGDGSYRLDFDGNIDIVVRTTDFTDDDFGPITTKYKEWYPFYQDIEYLNNMEEGWTSFSAYYQDEDEWGYSEYLCGMQFGSNQLVEQIKYLKVVYFDDNGDTILMSDEIKVPKVYFYQDRDATIYIDSRSGIINPHLEPSLNGYFVLAAIVVFGLILYSVAIELIVAFFFGLRTKKWLLHILLINLVTQLVMYIYFYTIFDSHRWNYQLQLIIYELLVLVVEYAYLHWRFKLVITPKKLAWYVLISNLVSYLLGIIRHN